MKLREWELEITFPDGSADWDGVRAPTLEKAIKKLKKRFVENVKVREATSGI